jgi:hypothetical protein
MKYAIVNENGITEIREDNYLLPSNAIELTDEQYSQLTNGQYILQNNEIVINPNPLK